MLIELLRKDAIISQYLCGECKENDISIEFDKNIAPNDIIIIKVDDYYNAMVQSNDRPKSPDCLIIQRCDDNTYLVYIVELRNIKSQEGFTVKEIEEKFNTCLDDFMSTRFGNYFHEAAYTYNNINLLFISDPYGFKENPDKQLKMKGHKLDFLMATRIPNTSGNIYTFNLKSQTHK